MRPPSINQPVSIKKFGKTQKMIVKLQPTCFENFFPSKSLKNSKNSKQSSKTIKKNRRIQKNFKKKFETTKFDF